VLYTHLVLQDYIGSRLPEKLVVCPSDRYRLLWQDVEGFEQNRYLPFQENANTPANRRWPYSSSYQVVPAMYSPDGAQAGGVDTVYQSTLGHGFYDTTGPNGAQGDLGKRLMVDVRFPSGKVQLHDGMDRHSQRNQDIFHLDPRAKQPLLMFDQSVATRQTRDANPGWMPHVPNSAAPTMVTYTPAGRLWEPQYVLPAQPGRYQWTRSGLKGIDFGGGEVKGTQGF
jgi:hypothetical protein